MALAFSSGLAAQDLIVTAKGDSINASVIKIKNGYIHFVFDYKGEIRRTLLPQDEVQHHKNFYSAGTVPEDQVPERYQHSRFRIGALGGFSYLTAPISDELPSAITDHVRNLKSGFHYGGNLDFFFSELFGVGIRYRTFRSRQDTEDARFLNFQTSSIVSGRIKDDVRLHYIGPVLVSHIASSSENIHVNFGLSAGYVNFNNLAFVIDEAVDIKADSYAIMLELGVEFMLDKNLAIGVGGSYSGLFFSKFRYEYENGDILINKLSDDNRDNWSRVDLGVCLTWWH